jgi:hypothetical protein
MYIKSINDDVHNMKNAESGHLRHSQELNPYPIAFPYGNAVG